MQRIKTDGSMQHRTERVSAVLCFASFHERIGGSLPLPTREQFYTESFSPHEPLFSSPFEHGIYFLSERTFTTFSFFLTAHHSQGNRLYA